MGKKSGVPQLSGTPAVFNTAPLPSAGPGLLGPACYPSRRHAGSHLQQGSGMDSVSLEAMGR